MPNVLLVSMPKKDESRLVKIFKSVGTPCVSASSYDTAFEKIGAEAPGLVIALDPGHLEPLHGLSSTLKSKAPTTPFIVVSSKSDSTQALKIMKTGAYDCLQKPFSRLDVLAAAKRAAARRGRTLFVAKVKPPQRPFLPVGLILMVLTVAGSVLFHQWNGAPMESFSLGSAHLTGLQWEGRTLWVGDWYDSNIIRYEARKGFIQKNRKLVASGLFKMTEGQPMIMCNTPTSLVTVGNDLLMRSHQLLVGLPTIQSTKTPGNQPTGLAWDGDYLWSSDLETGYLYRHSEDLSVLEKVKSILPQPQGIAYADGSFWVLGGTPLQLAQMKKVEKGFVWHGPYPANQILAEGVNPSGMAVGFGRLWLVSGGYPVLVSSDLKNLMKKPRKWDSPISEKDPTPKGKKSRKDE